MKYQVYDLGQLKKGERVQVILSGNAANVRLMNSSNYQNYKSGRRHQYAGGLIQKSPVVLGVPSSGHWYVTVDLQGLRGTVRSSAKVLPSALPTYQEAALSTVPSLVNDDDFMPDKGLANSKFGVVVLSKDFIKKGWTNYELDGIITKAVSGEQIVLPIWHNITKKEVIDFSPSLADKLARNTAAYTVEEIANEIAEVINK